jgi:hypothetical protein
MNSHFDRGIIPIPGSTAIQNQPTSTADSAAEDMAGEADEPPDDHSLIMSSRKPHTDSTFQKSAPSVGKRHSLLTQYLHTSESDSVSEEDQSTQLSDAHRTQSSTSTYSRSSATSMGELTSDGGHTSPRTSTPSPPIPYHKPSGLPLGFNKKIFNSNPSANVAHVEQVAPKVQLPEPECEKKVEAGLGRKRCIMFACPTKTPSTQSTVKAASPAPAEKPAQATKRPCTLKFACPPRRDDTPSTTRLQARLASPLPAHRSQASPSRNRAHRTSDATVKASSPKMLRRALATALRARRESGASDISHTEATRFHEFASSEEEVDDWTKESTCYQRRLTIDDTLEKELGLRKLAREVDEEEEEEEEEEEDELDLNDDDLLDDNDLKQSVSLESDEDEGFQTDDEEGFAHSDDDDDNNSEYDWWAPGRGTNNEHLEHIRPAGKLHRSDSESSVGSVQSNGLAIPGKPRRRRSRQREIPNQAPELPDSTDFVCGTLDEDKPMEQAFLNHLQQRRAAKHKVVPQDIDPTFPTSDPEIDDEEEDEVSEQDEAIESDHPLFLHGPMELQDDSETFHRPSRKAVIPKKRSPLHSPKRLRSPPPAKRISLHRSPPVSHFKRARSPAPFLRHRLSSSVPRNQHSNTARPSLFSPDTIAGTALAEEDMDNTPRVVNRSAIDIVMGLEKKRDRRREKLYERHCRLKAQREKKPMTKGKGAEKMRDLGLGLYEWRRGKKVQQITDPLHDAAEDSGKDAVHMLSY